MTNGTGIQTQRVSTEDNRVFVLDDPNRVLQVESGYLDVFVTTVNDAGNSGRRHYVGRVPAGGVAFGTEPLKSESTSGSRAVFIAVPGLKTVAHAGDYSTLISGRADFDKAGAEKADLDTVSRVDGWVSLVSAALTSGSPVPRNAELLEAKPGTVYEADTLLTAQHSEIIWLCVEEGNYSFAGCEPDIVGPGSPPIPLTERTWVTSRSPLRVSCRHTPMLLERGQLARALDSFNQIAMVILDAASAHQSEVERRRVVERAGASTDSVSRALDALGRPLGHVGRRPTSAGRTDSDLLRACEILGHHLGIHIDAPASGLGRMDFEAGCAAIGRASGLRTRKLSLTVDWWRSDGPCFIGQRTEDGSPIALLSGPAGYSAVNGDGTEIKVDAALATELSTSGIQFYRPLPATVISARDALVFATRGLGRDAKLLATMGVLAGLLALLTPIAMGELLAGVIPRGDTAMWIAILLAVGLGALGSASFEIVRGFALLRIEGRIDESLQAAVWDRLLSLPVSFFRKFTAGDLADRANGIDAIRQLLTGAAAISFLGAIFSIFSYVLLFWYSWKLALCATVALAALIGFTFLLARAQMTRQRAQFELQGEIEGIVFQLITGLGKLRVANAENHAFERWAERFATQKNHALKARQWNACMATLHSVFQPLASLVLFAFIYYQLIKGVDSPGFDLADFLSFNAAFAQLLGALTGTTVAVTAIAAAIPLFDRVRPILDTVPEKLPDAVDPGEISGDIEVSNLTYSYAEDLPPAVDRLSLRIRAGEYIALVGASGSGKSTLYRMLLGFDRPQSGAIFIDGHNLSGLDPVAYRQQIGVVLQNGHVIAASLFENIAGSLPLTMEEAWEAARAAGLEDDIQDMPMGMHTVLPEGGVGLSGGQKQRLLIARAIARKPRLLMFDEATSALDNRTQAVVQKTLSQIKATRIVIAHRLSTIRDVDRIYVMEAGRIVESGQYAELLEADGPFAQLAKRQIV